MTEPLPIAEYDNTMSNILIWAQNRQTYFSYCDENSEHASEEEMCEEYLKSWEECAKQSGIGKGKEKWEIYALIQNSESSNVTHDLDVLNGRLRQEDLVLYYNRERAFYNYLNKKKEVEWQKSQSKYDLPDISRWLKTQPRTPAGIDTSTSKGSVPPVLIPLKRQPRAENTKLRQELARAFVGFIEENLPNVKSFDASDSPINRYVVRLWQYLENKKMCNSKGVPRALFSFLQEDCGLSATVVEKSFVNLLNAKKRDLPKEYKDYMYDNVEDFMDKWLITK